MVVSGYIMECVEDVAGGSLGPRAGSVSRCPSLRVVALSSTWRCVLPAHVGSTRVRHHSAHPHARSVVALFWVMSEWRVQQR